MHNKQLPVKVGSCSFLPYPMTYAQAMRYGNRNLPKDLARAGFKTSIFESDPEIHGKHYYVVNYGKTIPKTT